MSVGAEFLPSGRLSQIAMLSGCFRELSSSRLDAQVLASPSSADLAVDFCFDLPQHFQQTLERRSCAENHFLPGEKGVRLGFIDSAL
jgi:hypothetical protein